MQNNIVRNYKIGDLSFKYIGPEFSEMEYLKIFRIEESAAMNSSIVYELFRQEKLALPAETCIHQGRYVDVYENGAIRTRVIYDRKKEHAIVKVISQSDFYHRVEYDAQHMSYWDTNMMMKVFDIPNQVMLHQGIFLHASCIMYQGQAIVFTAPKQVGKSTQAGLWEMHRNADVINGDRVLLRKIDGKWMAYGSPYAGTSRIFKNASAPIRAIVVLSQSQENVISELSTLESLMALMDGCSYDIWDRDSVVRATDVVNDILSDIRFIKLECLPDITAVKTLEDFLCQLKTEE